MKKMILILVALALALPAQAAMGPKRMAQCIFAPDKYDCSAKEKKEATGWLIGASAAALTAVAAAAAAIFGVKYSTAKKRLEEEKKNDQRARMQQSGEDIEGAKRTLEGLSAR